MPKTIYVTPSLTGGGAERLLVNLLLRQDAGDVSVVSVLPGGAYRPALERAGITVRDLGRLRRRDTVRALFQLAAIIREERPDAIFGWMYYGNLLALLAMLAARSRARLFWGVFCTNSCGSHLQWQRRFFRMTNALLSPRVHGVVYNAEEARDYHRTIGFRERRSEVIANCVDADVFRPDPSQRDAVRRELGIARDAIVIAVVARVDPQKDWQTVLDAVRDLPPNIVTIALGQRTESLPPQRGFIPLGWIDDVARVLSACDLFLLGSAFGEGTSLALTEAMLCELPCIVTNVGGNARLAGDDAIVIDARNVAAMRDAIVHLAADPERRAQLGRAARARAVAVQELNDPVGRLRSLIAGAAA